MDDLGHKWTEEELAALERRIYEVYSGAEKDLRQKADVYFAKLEERDKKQRALLEEGKITEEQYLQWRLAQIGRGKRFEALRDEMAERMTEANKTAMAYINDTTPGIYSLNRNYAAYTIERVAGNVGFDLWDEQTVKRLMVEQPDLMPYYPPKRALKRGIDLAWGKKQITASVTSSILQGKSIKSIANDLQSRITTMNRKSAIRTARTAVTGAQNAGRMDSYTAAQKMGIELQKEWLVTLDSRTRHSHAILDGEKVDNDKKFSNGCRFPGDPQGPPHEVYNCRCSLIAAVKGVDTSDGQRWDKDGLLPDMTYAQWEASKRGYSVLALSNIRDTELVEWRKSLQNKENLAILKAKIDGGEISTKLSRQQHAKHVAGTPQFEQYKTSRIEKGRTPQSILSLTEEQAQNIIDRYSGTGIVQITAGGKITEYCTTDMMVGQYYKDNTYRNTRRVGIFYAKRGAHIVPVTEEYDG